MQYYKLLPLIGEGQNAHAYISFSGLKEEDTFRLINGKKLENINSDKIELKNVTKKFPDLLGTGSSIYFITENFKNIIEEDIEDPRNINFVSVTLKKRNYRLLNILNNIECFDWEKSEYTTRSNPKALKTITRLALIERIE